MKMMKLTYLLTFAVAITLAVTGCKNHRPVGITPVHGTPTGNPSDADINTKPYNPGNEPQTIATAPIEMSPRAQGKPTWPNALDTGASILI